MTVNNDERLKKFNAILSLENQILFDDQETLKLLDRFLKKNDAIPLLQKMGLCLVYAYFCKRCNYVWIPRDFDPLTQDAFGGGQNIFYKKPPKSCARCKSKYWNKLPQRKTKHTPNPKEGMYGHDMLTKPRVQALQRNASRVRKNMSQQREHLEQNEKEFHRKMEQMGINDKKPIEVIMPKKKKKTKMAIYA